MTDSIDLKRIRHLVLLSEELHFSRAAERANLSQTAFSRSIQSLEADLGVRLFDRDTRSVVLTAAGRQLLASGRELLGCAGRLLAEANHIAQ
ncbi:MAG: LysR family transcriptional regulator, partial [Pseudomonas sp.]